MADQEPKFKVGDRVLVGDEWLSHATVIGVVREGNAFPGIRYQVELDYRWWRGKRKTWVKSFYVHEILEMRK